MYFNGTKCQLFLFSCFLSVSLFAKDTKNISVKSINEGGLQKPLLFVENKGQVMDENNHYRSDIQFKLASKGLNLYVGNGQLHYQFRKVEALKDAPMITSYNVDVTLLGADAYAKATALNKADYFENYYLAQTGSDGFSANAYSKIVYSNVYPNIDWVLYINDGKVEYDFIVRPGGNTNDIKIKYDGATQLEMTGDGGILAKTPMGNITENKLYAFETNTHKKVSSHYAVHDNIVSFVTGSYTGSLTIDPYLQWSTYYGGLNEDVATSVKCSFGSNIYVSGYTASANLTVGAFAGGTTCIQPVSGGGSYDAFMIKYNAAGTAQWATYFGGSGSDKGMGVALDQGGTGTYMVGSTTTTGTTLANPVATAYHNTNNGGTDGFLIKFNNNGARQWSTYFGGAGEDIGYSVICDNSVAAGPVYIGGSTTSPSLISTDGTFLDGAQDGFLAKFSTGGAIQWSTYYGGEGVDEIDAIGLNNTTFIAITGQTNSSSNIATPGANQSVMDGGNDAFIARYTSAGIRLWSTYLGGSGAEKGNGIASDANNNIYITGNTTSSDSMSSGIHYANIYNGSLDAFLTKVDANGVLQWSTYFGGANADDARGVCVDLNNNITIAGSTQSTGIASTGAYQTTFGGGTSDAFVAKYNQFGQKIYSTYFGKTNNDEANAVIADPAAAATTTNIIIAGLTSSGTATGFTTAGASQTTYGGGTSDGFTAKFLRDTIVGFRQLYLDTILCAGGSFTAHDTTNGNFAAGNIFRVQLSDATGSFATPVIIGSATTTLFGAINCTIPLATPAGTGYRIRIVSTNPVFTSVDNNIDISISAALPAFTPLANTPVCIGLTLNLTANVPYAVNSYSWSGPAAFASAVANPSIASVAITNGGTYSVTVTHTGCPATTATVNVVVNTVFPAAPTDSASSPICAGSTLYLFTRAAVATGTHTYSWTGPLGFTSTLQNPTIPGVTAAEAGIYNAIDTMDGCPSVSSPITIAIDPTDTPNIAVTVSPNDTVCAGDLVHFTTTVTNGGFSPGYQWLSGSATLIVGAVFDNYATTFFTSGAGIRCILIPGSGCHDKPTDTSNVILMTVFNNTPVVSISSTATTITSGTTVTLTGVASGPSITGYQWYVNNVAVPGATTTTLVLPSITHNDTVRMEVSSIAFCASVGVSNTIVIKIPTGVENITPSFQNIELFPNPNNGNFSVKGNVSGIQDGTISMDVTNAIGQVVYTATATVNNGIIDQSLDLKNIPVGMYLLRISKDGERQVLKFMKE